MNIEAIYHSMDSEYAYPISLDTMIIKLKAKKDDIKKCYLFYGERFSSDEDAPLQTIDMDKYSTDEYYDYFIAKFKSKYNRLFYYFKIDDGDNVFYYYDDKCYKKLNKERVGYYSYPYIRENDIVKTPEWIKDSVIYQIFPDSFATGSKKLISKNSTIIKNDIYYERNLGGTIRGIIENIDYLKDLGINCIYLNPIFKANSYHKYDTVDYFEIDPCFGDNNDFKELVDKLHKNGIRVILDGVFNHTSCDFFAFKDIVEKGEKSKYKDWYIVYEYPVNPKNKITYDTFAYAANMPRLNTANKEVMKYILDVGKYWIEEFDIDGWRLDVADEIDHNFWRKFRSEIKRVKSDAYIVGEIWGKCNSFLNGEQFDAVMNYNFTNSAVDYFAKGIITTEQFKNKLENMKVVYKEQIYQAMMNLLDSHDTNRFLYDCDNIEKFKLAVLFQFIYTGAPSIYYGDELGLSGRKGRGDKEIRKAMPWKEVINGNELLNYYKKLIKIRTQNIALRRGDFKIADYDNDTDVISFIREYGQNKVLIFINNGDKEVSAELPQEYKKIYDLYNEVYLDKNTLTLKPKEGYILRID